MSYRMSPPRLVAAVLCGVLALPYAASAQQRASATQIELLAESSAEYRVREQLARFNFPNDAVGTAPLAGRLVINHDGTLGEGDALTVDLRRLMSDSSRRDSFIRENTLQTSRFPLAEFVPRRVAGLPLPIPVAGAHTFTLVGDMTIHGVTAELTWQVEATFTQATVTGRATTRFPFKTFGLTIPKVMGLLSVDDDIRLVLRVTARRSS